MLANFPALPVNNKKAKGEDSVKIKSTVQKTVLTAAILTTGMALSQTTALADNFNLRIAAGHPAAPLAQVNQLQKTLVPNVTRCVAAETEHTVRFIEGYGGTIANLFEVL